MMVAPTAKRVPAAERRTQIETAARQLFGENGYAGTTLDDVAAAVGVTKPIVYRHFASKKALYLALLQRHADDLPMFAGDVEPVRSAQLEPLLRAILDGWLDYVRENSSSWLILFRDTTSDSEIETARQAVTVRAREVMSGIFRGLAPQMPDELVEPCAEYTIMGLAALVLWWIDHPEVPRETVLDSAVRVCAGTLQA